ncbi:MAG: flagellar biosynthesis protein FlhF [Enterobacterales bacterium]|jgi:flagellar biosynthesis protein FlhF
MKIRRFFANDMRKALKQVSDELGPDAAIMSTRKTKGGVEVVAATDYEAAMVQHKNTVDNKRSVSVKVDDDIDLSAQPQEQVASIRKKSSPDIEWHQEPDLMAIKQEVGLMRELLQDQLGELAWHDKSRRSPIQAALLRKLINMGFTPQLANEFAKTVTITDDFASGWKQLKQNLCAAMPPVENNILQKGGIVSLVGPTGVGKTTTIAKLAARYVLKHGPESIALVTTDSYRVAAHEQLRIYANIMGISMRVADSADSLSIILNELANKKLVLIDTAGISQRDKRLAEQMSCLINSGKSIDSYLVLSTTAQTLVLKDAIKTFSMIPLAGTILTKLDESVSLGESLGAVIASKLKIAYVTNGQRVPEDLHLADSGLLFEKAVTLEHDDAEDWVTAMKLNQG